MTGHWIVENEFDPNEWFGFVYKITDLTNDKEYIGRKNLWSIQRKKVKHRKNRKVVRKPSNWKSYTSSSTILKEEIKKKGKMKFKFEILSLHKTKGGLHYAEVETQVYQDVLRAKLPDGSRKFYNNSIANIKFVPGD